MWGTRRGRAAEQRAERCNDFDLNNPSATLPEDDDALEAAAWLMEQENAKLPDVSAALVAILEDPLLTQSFLWCDQQDAACVSLTLQKRRGKPFLVVQRIMTDPARREQGLATAAIRDTQQVAARHGWGVRVQSIQNNRVRRICSRLGFEERSACADDMEWQPLAGTGAR